MSIYYERELLSLLQVSTFDVSVVCRNVKCLHYILATGLVFFRIVCAGHVYTLFKDYIMTFSVLPYLTPTLLKQLITGKTFYEYLLCTGSTHRMKAGFLSVHVSGIHIRTSCRSGLACVFFYLMLSNPPKNVRYDLRTAVPYNIASGTGVGGDLFFFLSLTAASSLQQIMI